LLSAGLLRRTRLATGRPPLATKLPTPISDGGSHPHPRRTCSGDGRNEQQQAEIQGSGGGLALIWGGEAESPSMLAGSSRTTAALPAPVVSFRRGCGPRAAGRRKRLKENLYLGFLSPRRKISGWFAYAVGGRFSPIRDAF
jgi:hypothetical protein